MSSSNHIFCTFQTSKSAHCTPVAMQKLQKNSDMSLDYSSLGSEARKNHENTPEEYTKLLRRRMISEVLHNKPPNNDIWQLQSQNQNGGETSRNSRNHRETKRRPHRSS